MDVWGQSAETPEVPADRLKGDHSVVTAKDSIFTWGFWLHLLH